MKGGGGEGNGAHAVTLVDIEQEMRRSYLGYAVSTLVSRALPDVRDGFKPVARRVTYAMRELGLNPGTRPTKCAAVLGETMKRFHTHADQPFYTSLVRVRHTCPPPSPLLTLHTPS